MAEQFFLVAVIVSFLEQFGAMVFPDKAPIMSDLMEWISNVDEGDFNSRFSNRSELDHCCCFSVFGAARCPREIAEKTQAVGES